VHAPLHCHLQLPPKPEARHHAQTGHVPARRLSPRHGISALAPRDAGRRWMPVAMAICMHMANYHDRGRRGCRCIGLLPFDARGVFAIAFGISAHGAMSMPQVRVRCCDSCSACLLSTQPLISLGWPYQAWPGLAWPNLPSLNLAWPNMTYPTQA
jgi:hypothetical protein